MANEAKWMGRRIADAKDHDDLERSAARKQFHAGMPREAADDAAYDDYLKKTHGQAAAHHLSRMKSALSSGKKDVAERHEAMYEAHVKALGHKSSESPPAEIQQYMPTKGFKEVSDFSNHGADKLLLGNK